MAKGFYLPKKDKDKVVWLKNFNLKFSNYATALGFTAADVTAVGKDAAMFEYLVLIIAMYLHEKEQKVKYKQILAEGPIGHALGALPAPATLPAAPPAVPAGIFPRIAKIVQRIKNHPDYSEAVGRDLGVIGAEHTVDRIALKPALKLSLYGNAVVVEWTKGHADSIHIEVDRNDGAGWLFLAKDTQPDYLDTTPLPEKPVKWSYRAMYEIGDEFVGQWSSTESITVGK